MAQAEPHSSTPFVPARDEDTKTLTRADLAEALHRRTGFARGDAAKYVEMVLEEIFDAIVTRDEVKLSSFGSFNIRAKRERQGRNPKTGQDAKITARLVVTFRPSNVLRARVNNGFVSEDGDTGARAGEGAETGNRGGDGAAKGEGKDGAARDRRAYGPGQRRDAAELHGDGAAR